MRGLATRIYQRYWRLSRGLTLGAQGVVTDAQGRVLLVRHGYRPGWHFPGGGVEFNETVEEALAREMKEEAGVVVTGPVRLIGLYANFTYFPGDHIALYRIESWVQPAPPPPCREIAEHGFFLPDALPPETVPATRRRLAELFDGVPRDTNW